jgi:hypothetical protein
MLHTQEVAGSIPAPPTNTCSHGGPTMIYMSADLLAREFGRR